MWSSEGRTHPPECTHECPLQFQMPLELTRETTAGSLLLRTILNRHNTALSLAPNRNWKLEESWKISSTILLELKQCLCLQKCLGNSSGQCFHFFKLWLYLKRESMTTYTKGHTYNIDKVKRRLFTLDDCFIGLETTSSNIIPLNKQMKMLKCTLFLFL
jgi:hypothetical protein